MAQIIAIAMLAVALGGLYLAYQQRRTERAKLRLDAYPKQIQIFRCTESFLSRTWTGDYAYMPALLADFTTAQRRPVFYSIRKWLIISTPYMRGSRAIST
jgi:hypothetical protein